MAKKKPAVHIEFDMQKWKAAMDRYRKATKKDTATIVNHAATQTAFHAARPQNTKKAAMSGALGAVGDPTRERANWKYENRLFFALAAKQGATTGNRRATATKIWRRRRSSAGFIRANYGGIINKLGMKRARRFPKVPDVRVRKATPNSHLAYIGNAKLEGSGGPKAERELEKGIRRGMAIAANDMYKYATKKLEKSWKKSGRK